MSSSTPKRSSSPIQKLSRPSRPLPRASTFPTGLPSKRSNQTSGSDAVHFSSVPNSINSLASSNQSDPTQRNRIQDRNINSSNFAIDEFLSALPSSITSSIIPELNLVEPFPPLSAAISSSTCHAYAQEPATAQVAQVQQSTAQGNSSPTHQQRKKTAPTRKRAQRRRSATSVLASVNSPSSGTTPKTNSGSRPPSRESGRGRRRSPNSNLPCEICNQLYSRKDNLRAHQRVHSGVKPYRCSYCRAPFRWLGALRTHESLHLRQNDTRIVETSASAPEHGVLATDAPVKNAGHALDQPRSDDDGNNMDTEIEHGDAQLQSGDGRANSSIGYHEQADKVVHGDVMRVDEMGVEDVCEVLEPVTMSCMFPVSNAYAAPATGNQTGQPQNSENDGLIYESMHVDDGEGGVFTKKDLVDKFLLSDLGTTWASVWDDLPLDVPIVNDRTAM